MQTSKQSTFDSYRRHLFPKGVNEDTYTPELGKELAEKHIQLLKDAIADWKKEYVESKKPEPTKAKKEKK